MHRMQKVSHSQCMGFSVSILSRTRTCTKFTLPEVHFHTEAIGASLIVIACKMAKLFNFLHSQTQHDPTIVATLQSDWASGISLTSPA